MKLPRVQSDIMCKIRRSAKNAYTVYLLEQDCATFRSRGEARIFKRLLDSLLRRAVVGIYWNPGHQNSAIAAWAGYALIGSPYVVGVTSTIAS